MNRKIRYTLLFILTIKLIDSLVAGSLDYCYERTSYGESGGNLTAYLNFGTCDTLILGASRAQNGINPAVFGAQAYNLSYQQKHILFLTALIDILDQKKKLPQNLLLLHLEVEDFSASTDSINQLDIHYLKYFYDKNAFVRSEIQKSSPTTFLKYTMDSYRHNKTAIALVSDYFQRRNQTIGERGYYGLSMNSKSFDTTNVNLLSNKSDLFKASPLAKKCLQRILEICKRNQLKIIIVTAPLYRIDEKYERLSTQFSAHLKELELPYLNYNKEELNPHYPLSFWYDFKHLNLMGSKTFSADLKKQLKLKKQNL